MKVFQPRVASTIIASLITAAGLALCASAAADDYVISVQRTGPLDIYKNSCPFDTTRFTLICTPAPDEDLNIVFYLGGNNTAFTDEDPCDAQRQPDFAITSSGWTTVPAPNTYSVRLPSGHASVNVDVKALNSANPANCPGGYQRLLCSIPDGIQYTQGNYVPSDTDAYVEAHEYPALPAITMSVSPNNFPPNLHKGTTNTISFTLTASAAPPANMLVTFFLGGDGTAMSGSDPCLAYGGTDFTVSGVSQAPFPNGYYFTLGAGQTQKTVTVAPAGSGCECEEGFQTLLVTIPEPPACSGYTPAPSGSQTQGYIYPE